MGLRSLNSSFEHNKCCFLRLSKWAEPSSICLLARGQDFCLNPFYKSCRQAVFCLPKAAGRHLVSAVGPQGSAKWAHAGSPSRGREVVVHVKDVNQPSLPTPFCSVPVSISVSMALSTEFHSINSPDNPPLSHCVLPVLILPSYWSFQLLYSLRRSPSALI